MGAREFVGRVREAVIEQNLRSYGNVLRMPPPTIQDPRWQAIAAAYARMDGAQQAAVVLLVRQILVDTVSSVFGVLDGSSLLEGFRERFVLQYGHAGEKLNGDLQDLLLAAEE